MSIELQSFVSNALFIHYISLRRGIEFALCLSNKGHSSLKVKSLLVVLYFRIDLLSTSFANFVELSASYIQDD